MGTYPHFNPEKYNVKVKVAEVRTGSHTKFNINYHIIWIPKYRKSILVGRVAEVLRDIIEGSCREYGWECLALEIMPDHIHLFLSSRPNWQPSKIVNLLKGNTARQLRLVFPELKHLGYPKWSKKFPSLWARGYYCGSAGHVSSETVIKYILEQEKGGSSPFQYNIRTGQEVATELQQSATELQKQRKLEEWT